MYCFWVRADPKGYVSGRCLTPHVLSPVPRDGTGGDSARPSPAPRQHDTPWVVSWSLSLAATGQRGRGGWRDRHHAAQNPLLPAAVCGVCVCVQAHVAHVCQDRRPDPRPRVSLATETGIAAAAAAAAAPRSPSSEHSRLTPPPAAHTGPIRARSSSCVLSNSAGPGLISVFFLGLGSSCLNRWPASQGSTSLVRQHYCLIAPSLSSGDTSVSWQRDRTLLLPIWTHDKDWSVIGTVGTSVGQFSSSSSRSTLFLADPARSLVFFPLDAARRYAAQARPPSSPSSSSSSSFLDACAKQQPGYSRAKGSLDETHIHHQTRQERSHGIPGRVLQHQC